MKEAGIFLCDPLRCLCYFAVGGWDAFSKSWILKQSNKGDQALFARWIGEGEIGNDEEAKYLEWP